MAKLTAEEHQNLYQNFETRDLLYAVDCIDAARGYLNDGEHLEPPEIRTNLLTLHQLAMDVINYGDTSKAKEMFALADGLDFEIYSLIEYLEKIQTILNQLTALYPERLADEDD